MENICMCVVIVMRNKFITHQGDQIEYFLEQHIWKPRPQFIFNHKKQGEHPRNCFKNIGV